MHAGRLQNNHEQNDAYFPEVSVHTSRHGSYSLEGRILTNDPSKPASVMVVHGARSDFSGNDKLIVPLHEKGLSILSATISGHGVAGYQSDIPFSLDESLQEALAFSKLLQSNDCTLIGISMGGTTAVRLLQAEPHRFKRVVLFYPTAFPDEAYSVPFGTDEFRAIGNQKGAFLRSSFFDILSAFEGRILLIKGEYDGLNPADFQKGSENAVYTATINGREIYSPIPPEVFSKIRAERPDTEFFELPGADHRFSVWFKDHPEDLDVIVQKLFNFISREHTS